MLRRILYLFCILLISCKGDQENKGVNPADPVPEEQSRQEEYVRILGTSVSLIPPPGFIVGSQFPGLRQESTNASVIISELPAPLPEVLPAYVNEELLKERGLVLVEQQRLSDDQAWKMLVRHKKSDVDKDIFKWILIIGNTTNSVTVSATYPAEFEAEVSEILKQCLMTVKWDQKRSVPVDEGLDFTLEEQSPLQLAGRVINALVYNLGGKIPAATPGDPSFTVTSAVSGVSLNDREAFARAQLESSEIYTEIRIVQIEPIIIDNLAGYETIATARDTATRLDTLIHQTILFNENTYYLMTGAVARNQAADFLDIFKQMARSFQRK